MHLVLKVPEVTTVIFRSAPTQSCLFNCSLVCRSWATWATEILWRTGDVPFHCVLRIAAPLIWVVTGSKNLNTSAEVQLGVITEASWRRFVYLSSQISEQLIECVVNDIGTKSYMQAKEQFGGEPFGRLRKLKGVVVTRKCFAMLGLVSNASLRNVCIDGGAALGRTESPFLSQELPALAPNITRLSFGCVMNRRYTPLDLGRYMSLRRLVLLGMWINLETWKDVSRCPSLTEVFLGGFLDMGENAHWDWESPVEWHPVFPRLKRLCIGYGNARVSRKILTHTRMPMLERIELDRDTMPESDPIWHTVIEDLKKTSPFVDINGLYVATTFSEAEWDDWRYD